MGSSIDKIYYLKMDTDTTIVPQNIMYFLNDLNTLTYNFIHDNENPVHFGTRRCLDIEICYAQGGFYGLNAVALEKVLHYIQHNRVLFREVRRNVESKKNLMVNEDFFISYVFYKTFLSGDERDKFFIPMIDVFGGIYGRYVEFRGELFGDGGRTYNGVLSVHDLKDPALFYELENKLYDPRNKTLKSEYMHDTSRIIDLAIKKL